MANVSTDPGTLASVATCYCYNDEQWRKVMVYLLAQIAGCDAKAATHTLQELYAAKPEDPDLVVQRINDLKAAGITVAAGTSPQGAGRLASIASQAGVDIVVIRGTTVSAEHVSATEEPINLKKFIHELDAPVIVGGCATYQAALHLMRTGAAGVLVGFGGGASHTTADVIGVRVPMASAIADVAAARRDYLDESGGRYVAVIADGSMGRSGDMAKAIALGADAVVVGSAFARARGRASAIRQARSTSPRTSLNSGTYAGASSVFHAR